MDLEVEEDDWEYLPDAATYRRLLHDSDDALSIPLRSSPSVFNMVHFNTTASTSGSPTLLIPPPTPTPRANDVLHFQSDDDGDDVRTSNSNTPDADAEADAAASSNNNKVFFKTSFVSKEAIESVDMKFLDSSSSPTATSPRKTKFDDLFSEDQICRSLTLIKSDQTPKISDDVNWIGEGIIGDDYVINDAGTGDGDGGIIGGLNLWKLGFGGFGVICSFGVAAATLCLIIFGSNHKAKQTHKLHFQIYSADDQRMKQAVQQATEFNEAMSAAVRGVPLNRAHITYGGYYDNAL